jgi:2-C-methyl-D-erythritol 4-phosphate cytidylyltransferase
MSHAALLLAAGSGNRLRDHLPDKMLAILAGRPVITHSAEVFRQCGFISRLAVTFRDEEQRGQLVQAIAAAGWPAADTTWIQGGTERQDSVLAGLRALPPSTELVFIHDGARPCLALDSLEKLRAAALAHEAACLAHRVADTIKDSDPNGPAPLRSVDRSRLWAMETPQVFRLSLILEAYEKATTSGLRLTDDTGALEVDRHPIALVENPHPNPKLTTSRDLAYLEFLLSTRSNS